jgi:hypothetical protein
MDTEPESNSATATPSGTPVRQISVMLQNRVGALLSLVRLFNDQLVEVLGLSVQDSHDTTVVRLVVSDPDTVETLFIEKGINFATCDLLIVELKEGPTSLGACLSALLHAETNIYFSYPLLIQPTEKSLLALHVDDNDFGGQVLHNNGFKILFQEDLAR